MEKPATAPENDIATEKYHGPGSGITIAGYAYISHLAAMVGGMAIAGVAAYFAHAPVNRFVEKMRRLNNGEKGILNNLNKMIFGVKPGSHELNASLKNMHGPAKEKLADIIAHEERGFFENKAVDLVTKISRYKKAGTFIEGLKPEKLSAGFMGAGAGAALGYIGSTAWAFFKGHAHGNKGKHQFEQAQREIRHLRETNADLETVNAELHSKYVAAASEAAPAPKDAHHEKHPHEKPHDEKPHHKETHHEKPHADRPGTAKLHSSEHGGMLHEGHHAHPSLT